MSSVVQAKLWIRRPQWRSALAATALLCSACAQEPTVVPELRLLDLRPKQREGVYLNESLVMHFSGELDRASITSQSVRIIARDSTLAHGALFATGRELSFYPDPVRARDLMDGGYLPDTTYQLELAGFPRADAIRSVDGACLATTLRIDFHTVSIADRSSGYVFVDDSPDVAYPLLIPPGKGASGQPLRKLITPQSGLELESEEPIDPSSLSDDVFSLVRDDGDPPHAEIRLRTVLIENFNKRAFPSQGTTKLQLVPESLLPTGSYRLRVDPTRLHIRDFFEHPVPVIGRDVLQQLRITVVDEQGPEGEYTEDFLTTDKRSSALVPGADGTALWSSTGMLEVRFPAAAGDGSAGEVQLSARESATHLQAARLSVPEGVSCALDGAEGLCCLCSQGALEIAGVLRRTGKTRTGPFPSVSPGDTLSGWLERQQHEDQPLTVLVAGGDLRISGELDVPGPLLLVAGGRVRVSGRIRVAGADPALGAGMFTLPGEVGAIAVWYGPKENGVFESQIADASLVLDPPERNPLVLPLTYAVRSKSIPDQGHAQSWLPADGIRGHAGAGSIRVRYSGERRTPGGSGEVLVDDPSLLIDCPTLRLLMELTVPAGKGKAWDPPKIDAVRVRWKPDR